MHKDVDWRGKMLTTTRVVSKPCPWTPVYLAILLRVVLPQRYRGGAPRTLLRQHLLMSLNPTLS